MIKHKIHKAKSGLDYDCEYITYSHIVNSEVMYTFFSMANPVIYQFVLTSELETKNKVYFNNPEVDLEKLIVYIKNVKRERV